MKTIQEAANICGMQMCDIYGMTIDMSIPCEDSFEEGVKFAEEWLPIERDDDGWITDKQQDEMIINIPFLTKHEKEGIDVWYTLPLYILEDKKYSHWRPLNRK